LVPRLARTLTGAFYLGAPVPPEEVLDAYVADKTILVERLIGPHRAVRPVIADRFLASDLAYQETIWGIPAETSWPRYVAAGVPVPDVTIFLERPVASLLDRFDAKSPEQRTWWETRGSVTVLNDSFHRALDRLAEAGSRVEVIDVGGSPEDVLRAIDDQVLPHLTGNLMTTGKGTQ
jgi:dTMP kinase